MSPLILAFLVALLPAGAFAGDKMSPAEVQALARRYADLYGVPQSIVLRTVKRESTFNPAARNGPYWGLMQIRYDTAKGVGYRGPPQGLLDAETNLIYGVAYLANAYMIAGGNESMTHRLYRGGYYYAAKRKKLLSKLIKAPPPGQQPVLVTRLMPAAKAPPPAAAVPLPVAKPQIAAKPKVEDAPQMVAQAPAAAEALPPADPRAVAKPKVVLASVLPEPSLSLNFGREPEPASAAALALAAEAAPASEAAIPLPLPKPGRLASAAPEETQAVRDFNADYFDIPVKVLVAMPLPRPRPARSARISSADATVVASMASRSKAGPAE